MNSRTKALKIPRRVKELVWIRQGGKSIWSGKAITVDECCCHFVSRGRSGLGIEENIVGLTQEEHRIFDLNQPGDYRAIQQAMRRKARDHLMKFYPGWNEDDLKYRKWYERK